MFAVDLRETEHLAVGEWSSQSLAECLQIGNLGSAQGQTLLLVVGGDVGDTENGSRCGLDVEHRLVERAIDVLQHWVECGLSALLAGELLDAVDARQGHVLRDFHRVGTPGCDHLAPRPHVGAVHADVVHALPHEQPLQFSYLVGAQRMVAAHGIDGVRLFFEKDNHVRFRR